MDNNINFRRMLKFFIMKDLSLDNVVRDKYVQKHSLETNQLLYSWVMRMQNLVFYITTVIIPTTVIR